MLFVLVLVRGAWGLANLQRRPAHSGLIGRAAVAGHVAIYALIVIVPTVRFVAAAGDKRGFSFLGIQVFPAREAGMDCTVTVAFHTRRFPQAS